MSAESQVPEGVNPETGEVIEPEPAEPETETPFEEDAPELEDEPETEDEPAPPQQQLTVSKVAAMSEQEVQAAIEQGLVSEELLQKAIVQREKDEAKIAERLEGERQRHQKRLAEILQDDVLRLVPCELCRADLAGWLDSSTPIPEEVRQRVRIQIGDREPRKLRQDPHTERCATCDGETVVETGAKDGPNITLPCVDCGGKGWVATDDKRSGFRPAPLPVPPVSGQAEEANGGPVSHPALSSEDQEEINRLRGKGIVVIVPTPA